jgi:hypothetical protein
VPAAPAIPFRMPQLQGFIRPFYHRDLDEDF